MYDKPEIFEIFYNSNRVTLNFQLLEDSRPNLNLNEVCVTHDAFQCFEIINPDYGDDDEKYDILYDLAKRKGSENIIKLLVKDRIPDFDSNFSLVLENEPVY